RLVGTRPAEVWGLATKPSCSRSAITLRIVAGLRSSPEWRDRDRDPTGSPSTMYRSTRVLSSICARRSSMAVDSTESAPFGVCSPLRPRSFVTPTGACFNAGMPAFKTIALIGRYESPGVAKALATLGEYLRKQGCGVLVEKET